ncbi:MAG: hypothetical protein PVF79_03810 [Desulfobacterales bacterium]|jgi:hypothetical protein
MNEESKNQNFHNHRIRIAEETLELEKKKFEFEKTGAQFERRFFNRNLGVIITSIVTLTAIIVSIIQFYTNQRRIEEQQELEAISFIIDQINPKTDEQSFNKQLQYVRNVIKAAMPKHIANKILSRIDKSDLFLHQLEGWSADRQASDKRPVVLLLDTNYPPNVYSEFQKRLGGSNADDIFEILSNLPVRLVRDVIKANWNNEILIWKLKPELIIVHRSCFEYDHETIRKPEERFNEFIKKINDFLPKTKLIIYSTLDPEAFNDKLTNLKNINPNLLIKPYYVKDPWHFRALINADGLRREVINILRTNEPD